MGTDSFHLLRARERAAESKQELWEPSPALVMREVAVLRGAPKASWRTTSRAPELRLEPWELHLPSGGHTRDCFQLQAVHQTQCPDSQTRPFSRPWLRELPAEWHLLGGLGGMLTVKQPQNAAIAFLPLLSHQELDWGYAKLLGPLSGEADSCPGAPPKPFQFLSHDNLSPFLKHHHVRDQRVQAGRLSLGRTS